MKTSKIKGVKILGIKTTLPAYYIEYEKEFFKYSSDEKLLKRQQAVLGLNKRHVCLDSIDAYDLALNSAKQLIKELKIDTQLIDCVIYSSISHRFITPASSCLIHKDLKLREDCTCFDLSGLSCSGYVHSLIVAHSLINSGVANTILVIAADMLSSHTDVRNRISNILFGDAGTATILQKDENSPFNFFLNGTRGEGWNKIIAPASGSYLPIRKDITSEEIIDKKGNVWHLWDKIMKGIDVFKFSIDVCPKGIKELLNYSEISINEIDYFAIHQANKQIISSIASFVGLSTDKYSSSAFSEFGNCGVASVVNDLCLNVRNKKQKSHVLIATFGTGLSYGLAILDLSKTYFSEISFLETKKDDNIRKDKIKYWINYFLEE